jgi:hypothetical protein
MPRIDLPDDEVDAIASYLAHVDQSVPHPAIELKKISANVKLSTGSN